MYFLFSTIVTTIFTSLNAQNLNPSWETSEQLEKTARSENSGQSGQNGTSESWMDELNAYEIMVHQNFLHSSKLYPSKLKLLLKVGLRLNSSMNFLRRELIIRIMESQNSHYFWTMTNWYQLLLEKRNRIFSLIWIYFGLIL